MGEAPCGAVQTCRDKLLGAIAGVKRRRRRCQLHALLEASLNVEILQEIEKRPLPPAINDDGVEGPSLHVEQLDASFLEQSCEWVLDQGQAHPVTTFDASLERARGSMHHVLADVRLVPKPELLPTSEHGPAQRCGTCRSGIGVAHDLAPEVIPPQGRHWPAHRKPPDRRARFRVHGAHRHVKAIDHEEAPDAPAVEPSTELDLALP
mmetsp:Transcript_78846/g.219209  ORF Transcript_78846/g.219209 Transcript_78846/m.219209 type:complete len:207 (-) Transcript_78846:713-1333(-)